jgi:hypothetical protein
MCDELLGHTVGSSIHVDWQPLAAQRADPRLHASEPMVRCGARQQEMSTWQKRGGRYARGRPDIREGHNKRRHRDWLSRRGPRSRARDLVQYLEAASAHPSAESYRRKVVSLLRPHVGDHLLVFGCGTGEEPCALLPLVGGAGRDVGIDSNQTGFTLDKSIARAAAAPIPDMDRALVRKPIRQKGRIRPPVVGERGAISCAAPGPSSAGSITTSGSGC